MNDNWQPARLPEVESRIAAESKSFEPIDEAQWAQVSVKPFLATVRRSEEYGDESVYVVARDGPAVIFFDDAEDTFSGARLNSAGHLKVRGSYGELKYALRRFRGAAA